MHRPGCLGRDGPGRCLFALGLAVQLLCLGPAWGQPSVGGGTKFAAGGYHSVGICADGSLWAWGENGYGQLGDGTSGDHASKSIPVRVDTANDWVAVTAGGLHTLALKQDRSLWGWGYTYHGELGNGYLHGGRSWSEQVLIGPLQTGVKPSIRVLGMGPSAQQAMRMRVAGGTLGTPYTIEAATSLIQPVTWTALFTTNPVALPFEFTDSDLGAAPQKFYRVRQP